MERGRIWLRNTVSSLQNSKETMSTYTPKLSLYPGRTPFSLRRSATRKRMAFVPPCDGSLRAHRIRPAWRSRAGAAWLEATSSRPLRLIDRSGGAYHPRPGFPLMLLRPTADQASQREERTNGNVVVVHQALFR